MYVDESGDCGLEESPSKYFVLSGLIIHELRWQAYLQEIIDFRRQLKEGYGLYMREEFHAAKFVVRTPRMLMRIKRNDRLTMIRKYADFLAKFTDLNVINIVINKKDKPADYDVFSNAWRCLIQRFENTISRHNFPGPANPDERGLIFCDHTDEGKLLRLSRKMRRYNIIPHKSSFSTGSRNLPLRYIIEDPSFRNSLDSYFIQSADLVAFLLYQKLAPNKYIRKHAGRNYFERLKPILCKSASSVDPHGIVWL